MVLQEHLMPEAATATSSREYMAAPCGLVSLVLLKCIPTSVLVIKIGELCWDVTDLLCARAHPPNTSVVDR